MIPAPFSQALLNEQLADMLESPQRARWRDNGIAYGRTQDLYRMPELAADLIHTIGARR